MTITTKQVLKSIAGILAGMIVITMVAEGIEFAIVTMLNGSVLTDQDAYFAIRNRPMVLVGKLFYNGTAAFLGGYIAAWIAGATHLRHGFILAALQFAGLVYGMTDPTISSTTPFWMWWALIITMMPLIVLGALLHGRRDAKKTQPSSPKQE